MDVGVGVGVVLLDVGVIVGVIVGVTVGVSVEVTVGVWVGVGVGAAVGGAPGAAIAAVPVNRAIEALSRSVFDTKATSEPDRPTNEPSDAERATIDAIAEIVAQGDKNTVALNACVDSYNQMRDLLNDKR